MTRKKVVDTLNDGWATVVGEGGQVELVQDVEPRFPATAAAPDPGAPAQPETVTKILLLVPLKQIHPNPYQPRTSEDIAVVTEFAVDIFHRGLLQEPRARAVNGHYELAFGHTRKAAFDMLARTGVPAAGIAPDARFEVMPLEVHELTNREMFEYAVSENVKRRDLNPIQQAASMSVYMAEFQASSREAGVLFGVSDATVRGTVRLLKLPEPVQKRIAGGEITQGVARKLLSIARIIPGEVTDIGDQVAKGGDPDHLIGYRLGKDKNVVTLWESWRKVDEPRAGAGLWLLTDEFPPENLPELTAKQLAELPGMGTGPAGEPLPKTRVKYYLGTLAADADPGLAARLANENPDDADVIERIALLLRPPACSACPFHVVSSGAHYCGLKACHTRKFKAYAQIELKRVLDEMSIPIYNPEFDGKTFLALNENGWGDDYERGAKLVKNKNLFLRLAAHRSDSKHRWTNSYCVRIGLVGDAAQKFVDERKSAVEQSKTNRTETEQRWARERANRAASQKFYDDRKIPAMFAAAFDGMDNLAAMCGLLRCDMPDKKKGKAVALAALRADLADKALNNGIWKPSELGPVALAKHLKKVATTWGVELPADLVETAKKYEVGDGVSTETENE